MGFGRTPRHVCQVLAVLGDGEESMRATLQAAIALADSERSRLTLVKTCAAGRAYTWVAPFAVGGAYLPPEMDSPEEAGRILSSLAEQVPNSIPLTMLVLGSDTQASILQLLRAGYYDAVVAERGLLSHCRRLRRQLHRDEVQIVDITGCLEDEGVGKIPAHASSSGVREDDAFDADQVSEGGRGRNAGLWPGLARRLAGAGGK
jgi:hypothetical protein